MCYKYVLSVLSDREIRAFCFCAFYQWLLLATNVGKRSIVDNGFDLLEYCHQLKVCQDRVFDHTEHDIFYYSYYSFPYSSNCEVKQLRRAA